MNLVTEPAQLRRLAEQLDRRGLHGDRELARRARIRATEIELGNEELRLMDELEVAQYLGSTHAGAGP